MANFDKPFLGNLLLGIGAMFQSFADGMRTSAYYQYQGQVAQSAGEKRQAQQEAALAKDKMTRDLLEYRTQLANDAAEYKAGLRTSTEQELQDIRTEAARTRTTDVGEIQLGQTKEREAQKRSDYTAMTPLMKQRAGGVQASRTANLPPKVPGAAGGGESATKRLDAIAGVLRPIDFKELTGQAARAVDDQADLELQSRKGRFGGFTLSPADSSSFISTNPNRRADALNEQTMMRLRPYFNDTQFRMLQNQVGQGRSVADVLFPSGTWEPEAPLRINEPGIQDAFPAPPGEVSDEDVLQQLRKRGKIPE